MKEKRKKMKYSKETILSMQSDLDYYKRNLAEARQEKEIYSKIIEIYEEVVTQQKRKIRKLEEKLNNNEL